MPRHILFITRALPLLASLGALVLLHTSSPPQASDFLRTLFCFQASTCSSTSHWGTAHLLGNLLALGVLGFLCKTPPAPVFVLAVATSLATGLLGLATQHGYIAPSWHPLPYRGSSNFVFALLGLLCTQQLSRRLLFAVAGAFAVFTAGVLALPALAALTPSSLPSGVATSHLVHFVSWSLGIAFGLLSTRGHLLFGAHSRPL